MAASELEIEPDLVSKHAACSYTNHQLTRSLCTHSHALSHSLVLCSASPPPPPIRKSPKRQTRLKRSWAHDCDPLTYPSFTSPHMHPHTLQHTFTPSHSHIPTHAPSHLTEYFTCNPPPPPPHTHTHTEQGTSPCGRGATQAEHKGHRWKERMEEVLFYCESVFFHTSYLLPSQ